MLISKEQLKKLAKKVSEAFSKKTELKHSTVLELFAQTLGFKDFNALSAAYDNKTKQTVTLSLEFQLVFTPPTFFATKQFAEEIGEPMAFCVELFGELKLKIFDPYLDEALLIKNTLIEQYGIEHPIVAEGKNYSLDALIEKHYKKLSPKNASFIKACIKKNCLYENTELIQNAYEVKMIAI